MQFSVATITHRWSGNPCSKMPGGEGIVDAIFGAYLACAIAVLLVAIALASRAARKQGANSRRVWMVHMTSAVVVITALPGFLIVDHQRTMRSVDKMNREMAAFGKVSIEFHPGHVSAEAEAIIGKLPPDNPFTVEALEHKTVERLYAPDIEWTASDLDAFENLPRRAEHAGIDAKHVNENIQIDANAATIQALVAWYRHRVDLAAASDFCKGHARCLQLLGDVVRRWCADHLALYWELNESQEFRQAVIKLGLDLRMVAANQFAFKQSCSDTSTHQQALQLRPESILAIDTPMPPANVAADKISLTVWKEEQRRSVLKQYGFRASITVVDVAGCNTHRTYFCWEEHESTKDDARHCSAIDLEDSEATFAGYKIEPIERLNMLRNLRPHVVKSATLSPAN